MVLRKLTGLFACALVLGVAAFASAGIPDLDETTANLAYGGTETLSLFNLPNGAGKSFTEAFLPSGGGTTDGTINLTLRDGFGDPISGFAAQDMWIASLDNGMVPCGGTAGADFNTDELGETVWAAPIFAGGNSEALCIVYINGDALTNSGGLALSFNSADISGDGVVNLSDAGFFSGYLGGTTYAGDYNYDGVVNVSDAGFMANSLGASCP